MDSYPIPLTLHIGYPRTATTLFQRKLNENNDHILFLGRKVSGLKAERWYQRKLYNYWEWIRFGKTTIDIDKSHRCILEALTMGEKNNMSASIISDETMCKPHRVNYHEGMVKRLKTIFPNAKIMLTIRNQVDLVLSLFGKELRSSIGNIYPVKDFDRWFMSGAGSSYVPIGTRFNYASLYSALIRYFDKDNISIFFFEDFINDPSKYVADVGRSIGVERFDMNPGNKLNASPLKMNSSPLGRFLLSKGGGLYNLRYLNKFPRALDFVYGKLLRRSINWDNFRLNDNRIRQLSTIFYESNDRFAELTGLDLNAYGYPTSMQVKRKYSFFS